MASDNYAGDSPEKRAARACFWAMAPPPTPELPALVLASRDGGDIEVLSRMGIPARAILAVDRDPRALELCRARHPESATYEAGDVADIAERFQGRFSSALLDFCAPVSSTIVDATIRVARKVAHTLGIVLMLGREAAGKNWVRLCSKSDYCDAQISALMPQFNLLSRAERRVRRRRVEVSIQDLFDRRARAQIDAVGAFSGMRINAGHIEINPTDAIREFEADTRYDNTARRALSARRDVIASALDFALGPTQMRVTRSKLALQYVGHQAPMAMLQMQLVPWREATLFDAFSPFVWVGIKKGEGELALKQLCLELPELGLDVDRLALAADVSRSTIAAWRAHRTMGTYYKTG